MDSLTGGLLGILQGLTEFLPVSSSGHLVIAERILGVKASAGLTFEVLLHLATLFAVLIYFRKKTLALLLSLFPPYTIDKNPSLGLVGIIILATIPAGIAGLLFENKVEQAFGSVRATGFFLLFTGLILLLTQLSKSANKDISPVRGLLIGLAQAVALLPGVSRSGMTISAGLFQKIEPAQAAEFSFLLSIPAVAGAVVLKSKKLLAVGLDTQAMDHYLVGALAALVVGYISIALLMKIVKRGKFFYFGVYCLLMGFLAAIFL